jgi:hypothetical protein
VVDPQSQLITAVEVLPGNVPDHQQALALVEQAEANTGMEVEETMGDCVYGDGPTRQAFAQAGRRLVAEVPNRSGQAYFPKEAFSIDLEMMTCVCPAGQECRTITTISSSDRYGARGTPLRAFRFDGAIWMHVPCAPLVFERDEGMAVRSCCILRRPCCKRPASSRRVRNSFPIGSSARPPSPGWRD